jgi:ActR/RegA family two-component response regulator
MLAVESGRDTARVMIVDDDDDLRQVVAMAVARRAGLVVVGEAAGGEEAVALAATTSPDVVILDLGLPDLAGEDVITRLRQAVPAVRIVVFSGWDEHQIAREVRDRGALAFATKGRDIGFLLDLVDQVAREPVEVVTAHLDQDLSSPGSARGLVTTACEGWGCSDALDGLHLVVTELVTNAVLHARSACDLRLEHRAGTIRVEVVDGGGGTPDIQLADGDSEHGRGLLIVAAYSQAWGVYSTGQGHKGVWAEVATA